jgi:hypothetical protein
MLAAARRMAVRSAVLAVLTAVAWPPAASGHHGGDVTIVRERDGVRVEVRTRVRSAPRVTVGPRKQPFELASDEPLEISPDALSQGVRVEVLNNRTVGLRLDVRLGDLSGPPGGQSIGEQALGLVPRAPKKLELPAAGSAVIAIGPAAAKLPPGDYRGWLSVSEPASDTVVRRAVALTVPGPTGKLAPKPGADKLTMVATRRWPWESDDMSLRGNELPLDLPAGTKEDQVAVPAGALGYLTGSSGSAAVLWDHVDQVAGRLTANLKLSGLDGSATYAGSIQLLTEPDDAGKVEVELSATDMVLWPIIALLIGIALALWVKRWVNVGRVAASLTERLAEIVATFRGADRDAADWTAGKPYAGYTIKGWFDGEAAALAAKLDNLGGITGLDKAAYDDVTERLGHMRDVAVTWSDFAEQLLDLDQKLAALPRNDAGALPAVHGALAPLLVGEVLADYEAYTARRQEVAEANLLLGSWLELHQLLVRYRAWAEAIAAQPGEPPPELEAANANLDEVRDELWTATTAADLQSWSTEDNLLAAEEALAGLGVPAGAPEIGDAAPAGPPAGGIAAMGLAAAAAPAPASAAPNWPALAQRARRRHFWGDVAVALIAAAVAVVSALQTLYFGETFGGWDDYVGALVWGLATEAGLAALVLALARIGRDAPADAGTVAELAIARE